MMHHSVLGSLTKIKPEESLVAGEAYFWYDPRALSFQDPQLVVYLQSIYPVDVIVKTSDGRRIRGPREFLWSTGKGNKISLKEYDGALKG
jgi:hypothetical protein